MGEDPIAAASATDRAAFGGKCLAAGVSKRRGLRLSHFESEDHRVPDRSLPQTCRRVGRACGAPTELTRDFDRSRGELPLQPRDQILELFDHRAHGVGL